jgi:uncharacterized protein YfaS (alpha-2-macroglobulin family)
MACAGHGVIVINTGNLISNDVETDNVTSQTIYARGYHEAPMFPMPGYGQRTGRNLKQPDFRPTLYWNGNLLTDASGKTGISFFTADIPAAYIVVINGITTRGELAHKQLTFRVK